VDSALDEGFIVVPTHSVMGTAALQKIDRLFSHEILDDYVLWTKCH